MNLINSRLSIRSNFSRAVLTAGLSVVPLITAAQFAPGKIPGELDISLQGAATYHIPLQVPPGVAGHQPKMGLIYSSRTGNGELGVGWSLEGLSAIGRCPSTMATDGFRRVVSHSVNDQFCIDGQRLINIKGPVGYNDSEYRTEIDSFRKVISKGYATGGVNSGPQYFLVKTKEGLTLEYGSTEDSRIEVSGSATVRTWLLSKVRDINGNEIVYKYRENNAFGDFYVSSISYAGNRRIEFQYEVRPDRRVFYEAGSRRSINERLRSINICIDANCDQVQLVYRINDATKPDNRSVVVRIEKISGGQVIGKTEFDYGQADFGWRAASNFLSPWHLSHEYRSHYLFPQGTNHEFHGHVSATGAKLQDINGDGLVDLLFNRSRSDGNHQRGAYLNTGSSWSWSDAYNVPADLFTSIDTHSRNEVWETYRDMGFQGKISDNGVRMVDLNADGLLDILFNRGMYPQTPGRTQPAGRAFLNTGNGWQPSAAYIPPWHLSIAAAGITGGFTGDVSDSGAKLIDLNGDGRVDMLWNLYIDAAPYAPNNRTQRGAYINTGSGWQRNDAYNVDRILSHAVVETQDYGIFAGKVSDAGAKFVDVNGDGLVDLLYHRQRWNAPSEIAALINTGAGWQSNPAYHPPWPLSHDILGKGNIFRGNIGETGAEFVDLNGDGLVDIIWDRWRSSEVDRQRGAWLNTGNGWARHDEYLLPVSLSHDVKFNDFKGRISRTGGHFIDVNADGLVDYVFNRQRIGPDRQSGAYINTGSGWQYSSTYIPPISLSQDVREVTFNTQQPLGNFVGEIASTGVQLVDLNGDGVLDLLYDKWKTSPQDQQRGAFLNAARPLLLKKIVQGSSVTEIDHVSIAQKESGYTGSNGFSYPIVHILPPMYVVRSVKAPNGALPPVERIFSYHTLRYQHASSIIGSGRGLLGFHERHELNKATGIETHVTMEIFWPLSGLPGKVIGYLPGRVYERKLFETYTGHECMFNGFQEGRSYTRGEFDRCYFSGDNTLGEIRFIAETFKSEVKYDPISGTEFPPKQKITEYRRAADESGKLRYFGSPAYQREEIYDFPQYGYGDDIPSWYQWSLVVSKTVDFTYHPVKTTGDEWVVGKVKSSIERNASSEIYDAAIWNVNRAAIGSAGRDTIVAGIGNNIIEGGGGADELMAGDGKDTFVYRDFRDAVDNIQNFDTLNDKIDLRPLLAKFGVSGTGVLTGHVVFSPLNTSGGITISIDTDGTSGPAPARHLVTIYQSTGFNGEHNIQLTQDILVR